ncbi:MAG: complex I NDUFA9 subunit family protein [Bdellovibrionales bacterium]
MNHHSQITIFGASGLIGRHLVRRVAQTGAVIRVPTRDLEKSLVLKPMGGPGQIAPVLCALRSDASVAEAIGKADTVVNLVGTLYEKGRDSFQAIHVEGAARIARAARECGARRFIHVSSLAADKNSPASYGRSKAASEEAVRSIFPEATIIRPSLVTGPEDRFFSMFAKMARISPFLPLIGGGGTQFQPVYVGDVAEAMLRVLDSPDTQGKVYALGGPQIYTFRRLMEMMLEAMGIRRQFVAVPWGLATMLGTVMELLPCPPLTRDQVELLKSDNVVCPGKCVHTLSDLGVTPTPIETVLPVF